MFSTLPIIAFLVLQVFATLDKNNHNFKLMIKHGVHFQNQSIISKKYQNLFKIPQNDKTDPGFKGPSSRIRFAIL